MKVLKKTYKERCLRLKNNQFYFEEVQIPARVAIKRIQIVFFRYVLTQKEESLLFRFLLAQKRETRRGDYYSAFQNTLKENINEMPEKLFKSIVKKNKLKVLLYNTLKITKVMVIRGQKLKTKTWAYKII